MMNSKSILTSEAERFYREWLNSDDYVMAHTSGSTGKPKSIRLLKSDMTASAEATNRFFCISGDSHLWLPLSTDYIAGKMMVVRAHLAGCRLTTEVPSNRPFQSIKECVDLAAVVPSQCQSIIKNVDALKYLKNIIVEGAPLNREAEKKLCGTSVKGYATYGMTETCSHVALRELGCSLYEALPGISFSQDERGCLVIDAGQMSFKKLVTNDIIELDGNFRFRWIGRADNVVNSGGIKIYPEELENSLAAYLRQPFIIRGTSHPKWGECLEVVVELSNDKMHNENVVSEIFNQVACFFDEADNPVHPHPLISFTTHLPRTQNGKLKRK